MANKKEEKDANVGLAEGTMAKKEDLISGELLAVDLAPELPPEMVNVSMVGAAEADTESKESESEQNRKARIEELFSAYPITCESLKRNEDFDPNFYVERSMSMVSGYVQARGLPAPLVDRSLNMLFHINLGGMMNFNAEEFDVITKGLSYDADISEAVAAAELRVRNSKIEAKMKEPVESDGLPHLSSGGVITRKKSANIFTLADEAR